jgi:hypothetical protein
LENVEFSVFQLFVKNNLENEKNSVVNIPMKYGGFPNNKGAKFL